MKYKWIHLYKQTAHTSVVLVEDIRTGKRYVEKSVLKSADPIAIHQWRKEVDVLSNWQDPYIPELVDVSETKESYVLIESYIAADTLDTWVKKHPLLKRFYRQRFICQMMHWMDTIHQMGYVYVDLKPQNVLVKHAQIYLIDFNSCIEMGNQTILSASKFNLDPKWLEMETISEKIDDMGLKKMIRFLYPFDPILPVFSNFFVWMLRLKRSLVILCIIYLSVFFMATSFHSDMDTYLQSGASQDFMVAYKAEKKMLYVWIENGWISKEVYANPKSASFLIQEAIKTKDTELCTYIYRHIPYSTQIKIPQSMGELIHWMDIQPSKQWMDHYIAYVSKHPEIKTMDTFLKYCLKHQIELSNESWKHVYRWPSLVTCNDSFADDYLEYCLFLRSIKGRQIQLPQSIEDFFSQTENDSDIYQLWRKVK